MFIHCESETIVTLPTKNQGEVERVRWQKIYRLASRVFDEMCLKTDEEIDVIRSSDTFKRLNKIWRTCYFNTRQMIGSPTMIYREGQCETVEEFYEYYFYSSRSHSQDSWKKGRNMGHLCQIGIDFYTHVCTKERLFLELPYFFECMWIFIFYLTHIGMQREIKTLNKLKYQYPFLEIRESENQTDYGYAVDCEAWYEGVLIMAFQIKSRSFLNDLVRHESAGLKYRPFDLRKQLTYQERFGVQVYTLISDENGEIMCMLEIENDTYTLARTKREKRAIQRAKRREKEAELEAARKNQMRAYHSYSIDELDLKPSYTQNSFIHKPIKATSTHFDNGFEVLKDLFA